MKGDSGDGSEDGTWVDALDDDGDDFDDDDITVAIAVAVIVVMDVGMDDDLTVDSCEGWHLDDEDRLVGAKDGTDALKLLEMGATVASSVGAVLALKAVAIMVGLVVLDWALVGIAEVLRLLELVAGVDGVVCEAVGAMEDVVVADDDGGGSCRAVDVVGVVVTVAVVVAVEDAVLAVGTTVAS